MSGCVLPSNLQQISIEPTSVVLDHSQCDWDSAYKVLDICCGAGYMGEGAKLAGLKVVAGCDFNKNFTEKYHELTGLPVVLGDVSSTATLAKLWEISTGNHGIAAGVSCQPYSLLGDRKSSDDKRSSSLTGTLEAIHFLRAPWAVLECVEPVSSDDFVQGEISKFCKLTGYTNHQTVLHLHSVWPSRRSRWWCILLSPAFAMRQLHPFPPIASVARIN